MKRFPTLQLITLLKVLRGKGMKPDVGSWGLTGGVSGEQKLPIPLWKGNSQQVPSDCTTLPYFYNGTLLLLCILSHGQSQELLAMLNQPCFGWLGIITPRYLNLAFWALCARQPTNTTQKHCWVSKDAAVSASALYYSSGNDWLIFQCDKIQWILPKLDGNLKA